MKTQLSFVLMYVLFSGNILCAEAPGYVIRERGLNYRVLEKTTHKNGTNVLQKYTELATGMYYTNASGQLSEAREEIAVLLQGGAAATQGLHQVYFPADIYNGVIEVVSPDGQHIRSRPLGISYDDGSNTVWIGMLKHSVGVLTSSNAITYPDAFTGIKADLVCTYRRGGFESDLTFRQQPQVPDNYGLDPQWATIQLVTEFFNTPDPQQIPSASDEWFGLEDVTLKFGKLQMAQGRAFAVNTNANSQLRTRGPVTPVFKSWLKYSERRFLIEQVPMVCLADDLRTLPLTASVIPGDLGSKPRSLLTASLSAESAPGTLDYPELDSGGILLGTKSKQRMLPPQRAQAPDTNHIQIASASLDKAPGVVIDYNEIIVNQNDFSFTPGTWYVSGQIAFDGTVTFYGSAVIKMDQNGEMIIHNGEGIVCTSSPENPTVFTSINDDSVGQIISNSSGSPQTGDVGTFMQVIGNTVLRNMRFYYGWMPIDAGQIGSPDTLLEMWDCQVLAADQAILGASIALHNVIISEPIVGSDPAVCFSGSSLACEHVTIYMDGQWLAQYSDYATVALTNFLATDSWGDAAYSVGGASQDLQYLNSSNPFYTTAGRANYYLAVNSPFRDIGTQNISPGLLTEMREMTTYAPQDGGYPDSGALDVGYHYPINEDSDHDALPDWWEWRYFHCFSLCGTNVDANDKPLLYDYQHGLDPDVVQFTIGMTNQFVKTSSPVLQMEITAGVPGNYAVLVDSTNFSGATWTSYGSSNITLSLGNAEGWHKIWVGLKGFAPNAIQTWAGTRLKLDLTPPTLVVTNPVSTAVKQPMIQVQGYSIEALAGISYDLQNALGLVSHQNVFLLNRHYSTNTWEFTTNFFQAFDVPVTNGVNTIILHATDLAGNTATANFTFTLDYSSKPAPLIELFWPQDGTRLSGNSFTWRGHVDDFTASVVAQVTDAGGKTTVVNAIVERDGNFWAEGLPVVNGQNYLTLTATDAAGNVVSKAITVVKSSVNLTFNDMSANQLWNSKVTASGSVDSSDYSIWVNGVKASLDASGNWQAQDVPTTPGGTAVFQMRAIPNTDNGGYGTGGGWGGVVAYDNLGNPASAGAQDAEAHTDKPSRLYLQSYVEEISIHTDWDYTDSDGDGNFIVSGTRHFTWKQDLNWGDGRGGSGNQSDQDNWTYQYPTYQEPYSMQWSSQQTWPASSWPVLVGGTQTASGDYDWPVFDPNIGPPQILKEHCGLTFPCGNQWKDYNWEPGIYEDGEYSCTYEPCCDAVMKLQTGGKGIPGQQKLWQLSGSATRYIPINTGPYAPIIESLSLPVEPQSIQIQGKNLGSDGNLYIVLPDNTEVDVTPNVSGAECYAFDVNAQEYPLYIMANRAPLDPVNPLDSRFIVGQEVTFELSSLPSGVTENNIQWTFDGKFFNHQSLAVPGSWYPRCAMVPDVDTSQLNSIPTTAWWVSGGAHPNMPATYETTVSCTLVFPNGNSPQSICVSGLFNMFRPQGRINPQITSVNVLPGDVLPPGPPNFKSGHDYLVFATAYGYGIIFYSTLTPPDGFEAGELHWIQLITSVDRTVTDANSDVHTLVPYEPAPYIDLDPFRSGFSAEYPERPDGINPADSPRTDLTSLPSGYKGVKDFDKFEMWMLFKPTGVEGNTHNVPLRAVTWWWKGRATNGPSGWVLDPSATDRHVDPDFDTQDYPIWRTYLNSDYPFPNNYYWSPEIK